MRGRDPRGRRCPGHRGPDARQPLPGGGGGAAHRAGGQQDRPRRRAARDGRRGDRRRHRPTTLGGHLRLGEARHRHAGHPGGGHRARAAATGRRERAPEGAHLRLALRHLPRRHHLRSCRRRRDPAAHQDPDDEHGQGPRRGRGRLVCAAAPAGGKADGRRGRLRDRGDQERDRRARGRHRHDRRARRQDGAARLPPGEADGFRGAFPDRLRPVLGLEGGAGEAAAQRCSPFLRAGELRGAGLRLSLRLPGPAAPRDRAGAPRARVRARADHDRADRGVRGPAASWGHVARRQPCPAAGPHHHRIGLGAVREAVDHRPVHLCRRDDGALPGSARHVQASRASSRRTHRPRLRDAARRDHP